MDESSTAGIDVRGRLGAVRVAGAVAGRGGAHPGASLRAGAFRPDALRERTPSRTRPTRLDGLGTTQNSPPACGGSMTRRCLVDSSNALPLPASPDVRPLSS